MTISNGGSFSAPSDTAQYPEMWVYRLQQPVQDRDSG